MTGTLTSLERGRDRVRIGGQTALALEGEHLVTDRFDWSRRRAAKVGS